MIKISRACFILMFATVGAMFFIAMAGLAVGFLHGDHRTYSISGSPSLDSPAIPYWVHWTHVAMFDGVYIIVASLILGFLTLVLSAKLQKKT